jgi:cytosine/adenosine deaminase-related metal-dependent hydrolase
VQVALDHGIRPSLSVDVETQMTGDMFTQMRTVFALQRMQAIERQRLGDERVPALLSVRDVVEFATVQGAAANQLDGRTGSLTPGKQADVILLRADAINVLPLNDAYGAVVLGMDTSNVDTVFVAGRAAKRGGALVGVDLERVRRDAEASRDRIYAAVGWPRTRV